MKISSLMNPALYFFEFVFIIDDADKYRLIVAHRGHILCDAHFRTIRGARIAFEKTFNRKKTVKIKSEWTSFYVPNAKWFEDILNRLKRPEPES